ncbi:MAG TPA: sulfatase-like hydrolase/transferase [Vicinamibacterales bacterium]|nr:sulfatase-like hydrolase/transferase [Vicinamibacterales bacterium]
MSGIVRPFIVTLLAALASGCTAEPAPPAAPPARRHVVLITIDTLRADRVGAYGGAARTPAIDALAREGARFDRAYATAPITLTSHASLMTGRYPPGHGGRHNGMRVSLEPRTLADAFARAGYATGGFVGAFPLDRRFGLIKGFAHYGDQMPRDDRGRIANDRPGRAVVDDALAWVAGKRSERIFLWVHLFEPHAPYGRPGAGGTALARYDADIAEADAQIARLLTGLGFDRARTLFVVAGDHGEAFGEHGEVSHSVFTYDTTLRIPLVFSGAGIAGGQASADPVSIVDVAPTIAAIAGLGPFDADGQAILRPEGGSFVPVTSGDRALYAESFAPMLDFGWAPLRAMRRGRWKYIAAPKPELYDVQRDPGETQNVISSQPTAAADLARQVEAISGAALPARSAPEDREARARLQALGYAGGRGDGGGERPDPKDRRELAAQIARVASGELQGSALEGALREILRADPANPQASLRLGYVLMESGRCRDAIPRFNAAIGAGVPGADAYLGLAGCQTAAKNLVAATRTLTAAQAIEPENAVVSANLGLVLSDSGQPGAAIPHLQRALSLDPDLHQGRFGLALAYARAGRRAEAERETRELLRRLPPTAPQRPEVERLLASLR